MLTEQNISKIVAWVRGSMYQEALYVLVVGKIKKLILGRKFAQKYSLLSFFYPVESYD
jgi:hypothetical protein